MHVTCDICSFNLAGSIDSADTETLLGFPVGAALGTNSFISPISSSSSSSESEDGSSFSSGAFSSSLAAGAAEAVAAGAAALVLHLFELIKKEINYF